MARLILGTHILRALKEHDIPIDRVTELSDHQADLSMPSSVVKGHDELAIEKAGFENVFWIDWPDYSYSYHYTNLANNQGSPRYRLYFFAFTEKEVIDRFGIAQVMFM